jgi:hypothetical protein
VNFDWAAGVGVADLNERRRRGFVTGANDEQHCGAVIRASWS